MKREYRSADVNHLGYWYKGSLPEDYTLPKQKDPINKSRLIASCFKRPLSHVFKNVSRILAWMFTTIKKRYGMFTLYKLTDIKERLSDAMRVLTKNFGPKTNVITVQTDVTQMYTNLNHDQIRAALMWMCDRARNQYNKQTKNNT